jgi:hypothetical protein
LNRIIDAKLGLRVVPGSYVQVTAHETDNSMKPRMLDAMALDPLRNNKGSYRYFLIESRRLVTADHLQGAAVLFSGGPYPDELEISFIIFNITKEKSSGSSASICRCWIMLMLVMLEMFMLLVSTPFSG